MVGTVLPGQACPVVGSTLADLAADLVQIPGASRQLFHWFEESDAMKAAARGWMLRGLLRTNNIWLPTALAEIQKLTESARAYAYQWLRGYPEVLDVSPLTPPSSGPPSGRREASSS